MWIQLLPLGLIDGAGSDVVAPSASVGGGRSKKRKRLTVEIDGEQFEVRSPYEARQLLLDARRAVEEELKEPVKKAVNGKLSIKKPEITVIGDSGPELTEIIEAIADIRKEITAMYRAALKTIEIAHLMQISEEEDEIMVLM